MAKDWWNPNGKFKPLHLFNPARIKFIKEKLISHFKIDINNEKPLKQLKILDIGCGGGLLSERLCRLGATMTGINASKNNIEVAKIHSNEMGLNINYIHTSPENLNFINEFDVILNMEIIEHVSNTNLFIKNCSKLIKKNGMMFVATINKNLKSYVFISTEETKYIFKLFNLQWLIKWKRFSSEDLPKTSSIKTFLLVSMILEKLLLYETALFLYFHRFAK